MTKEENPKWLKTTSLRRLQRLSLPGIWFPWDIFGRGVLLGLGAAVPIGPVNVEMARRTLRGGAWAGFALGCGAVTVDVFYCVVSSFSVGVLLTWRWVKWPTGIAGALFLAYLGVQALRAARKHAHADPLAAGMAVTPALSGYRTGVLMTLLNPMTVVFWFLVQSSVGGTTQDLGHKLPMICTGVFIGTIGWVITFTGFLGFLGRWRRNWWLVAADGLGGAMLLLLAGYGLWQLIHQPL